MLPYVYVFVLSSVTVLAGLWFAYGYKSFGLPGRKSWNVPFFGGLFDIIQNWEVLLDFLLDLQEEFGYKTVGIPGPFFGSIAGGVIVIYSPENVDHVLNKNFGNYVKGQNVNDALKDFLGDGIFASDGKIWKKHRKVASRMFSRKLMRNGTAVALSNAKKVVQHIEGISKRNESFDLADIFFRFTMDTFVEIAFGEKLGSLKKSHPFASAFDEVQYLCEKRFRNPLWKIQQWIPANEQQTIRRNIATMNAFAKRVIKTTKDRHAANDGSPKSMDLISRFLADSKQRKMPPPSVVELRDIVMNFIIAGRDTTACALSWQFFNICRDSDANGPILDNILKELLTARERVPELKSTYIYDLPYEIAFELVTKHLPYLNAVTKETLRLHPSVPKNLKFAIDADLLPDGTKIPAGCAVLWSPYCMGRNPNIWGKRAKVYDPSRWFEDGDISKPLKKDPSNSDYPAFHLMPRLCLGKPLAIMEIVLLTASLVESFNFKATGPSKPEYKSTLVLPMKNGMFVRATARV
eukprot:g4737.t1